MKESVVRNSQKRSKYPRKNYIKLLLCADDHNGGEGEAKLVSGTSGYNKTKQCRGSKSRSVYVFCELHVRNVVKTLVQHGLLLTPSEQLLLLIAWVCGKSAADTQKQQNTYKCFGFFCMIMQFLFAPDFLHSWFSIDLLVPVDMTVILLQEAGSSRASESWWRRDGAKGELWFQR